MINTYLLSHTIFGRCGGQLSRPKGQKLSQVSGSFPRSPDSIDSHTFRALRVDAFAAPYGHHDAENEAAAFLADGAIQHCTGKQGLAGPCCAYVGQTTD